MLTFHMWHNNYPYAVIPWNIRNKPAFRLQTLRQTLSIFASKSNKIQSGLHNKLKTSFFDAISEQLCVLHASANDFLETFHAQRFENCPCRSRCGSSSCSYKCVLDLVGYVRCFSFDIIQCFCVFEEDASC